MTRLISFAVLIAIIIIIGLLFYKVLIGFFIPVFLASVLVVVFHPLHRWVLEKTGQREQLAALITTLLIMLVLILPFGALGTASTVQGLRLIEQNDAKTVALRLSQIRSRLGLEMPPYHEQLRVVGEELDEIIKLTADSVVSDENNKLGQVGKRTTKTLKELQIAVAATATVGELYDQQFKDLIEMSEKVGSEKVGAETVRAETVGSETVGSEKVGQSSEEEFGATKLAVDLKSKFSTLRTGLLGGTIMAFARDTVNPTKDRIDAMVDEAVNFVRPRLLSFTGATGTFVIKLVIGIVIMILSTYFFLVDGPAMIKSVMHLSPLDDTYEQELLLEFDRISRAVVLATILSALAQGLTAGIGFYFAGMEYLTLLIMLTTAFAMIPFVGPSIVWIPVCLSLVMNDQLWAAGLLALWGVLVVGTVDNIVKALVLHGQSQLHPLLALLSVLGGVQSLGPIGIVVGPMVVAMLQTLLSILRRELLHFEQHKFVLSTAGVVATGAPTANSANDTKVSGNGPTDRAQSVSTAATTTQSTPESSLSESTDARTS